MGEAMHVAGEDLPSLNYQQLDNAKWKFLPKSN
jgi:hypothetical protein